MHFLVLPRLTQTALEKAAKETKPAVPEKTGRIDLKGATEVVEKAIEVEELLEVKTSRSMTHKRKRKSLIASKLVLIINDSCEIPS